MDSELKSATSKRRAPDDSSGAVKKVVLDMETFTTNTIQVSAGIPSQNVEQTNEMDPPEKCNESQTGQECASTTRTDEVDDAIKTVNGSVNDTPSIQTREPEQTVAQDDYTHLVNERVNVKPQECGSKDLNVFEKDGGQCADVSQTQYSGDPRGCWINSS